MALEYEDIDLGQVSEVTKEEFDLAKLEAEGWVTELVISGHDANELTLSAALDGADYNDDTNPILAIKVNNELVEPIREIYAGDGSIEYARRLNMDLPVGTSIKIYHDPNTVDKCEVQLESFNSTIDGDGGSPVLDIYKCVKRIQSFTIESTHIRCYSLPKSMDKVYLANCVEITAHVPSNVRYVEITPAFTETNDADGNEIWKYVDLEVHLDGLPEELYIYGDTEAQPDLHVKAYVPYHLLDEAKNKFPGYAEFIDALVPASKVREVGCGKLYNHYINFVYRGDLGLGSEDSTIILCFNIITKSNTPFTEQTKNECIKHLGGTPGGIILEDINQYGTIIAQSESFGENGDMSIYVEPYVSVSVDGEIYGHLSLTTYLAELISLEDQVTELGEHNWGE